MVYAAGDKAYLRVTPLRGTHRFGVKGKLAPRYVGPFNILSRRAENAYRLELPEKLSKVHDVFHVSQLKKCFKDPDRAVDHEDRKSTRLNSSHITRSRMPSSACRKCLSS